MFIASACVRGRVHVRGDGARGRVYVRGGGARGRVYVCGGMVHVSLSGSEREEVYHAHTQMKV